MRGLQCTIPSRLSRKPNPFEVDLLSVLSGPPPSQSENKSDFKSGRTTKYLNKRLKGIVDRMLFHYGPGHNNIILRGALTGHSVA